MNGSRQGRGVRPPAGHQADEPAKLFALTTKKRAIAWKRTADVDIGADADGPVSRLQLIGDGMMWKTVLLLIGFLAGCQGMDGGSAYFGGPGPRGPVAPVGNPYAFGGTPYAFGGTPYGGNPYVSRSNPFIAWQRGQ